MNELFGLPISTLAVVLPIVLGMVLAVMAGMAIRKPVLLRLSGRYAARRIGRTALIVLGLMLGTAMIMAALSTGDTMTYTIRYIELSALGNIDEVISSQEESDIEITGESAELRYIDESAFAEVRDAFMATGQVDAIAPVIAETVGVQDVTTEQTEPRVYLTAMDPAEGDSFIEAKDSHGQRALVAALEPAEVYLNRDAAEELDARAGDKLAVYAGAGAGEFRVREIVTGIGTESVVPGMIMRLDSAQALFDRAGEVRHIVVSNNGDATSGVELTDAVIGATAPTLERLGLFIEPTKQEDLQSADEAGSAFMTFFMTFGTFAIIAGMMLIFLIFVMLAAERKSEMGIARAVGTERRHLVEMFMFEGTVYDLLAAAVGVLLGIGVAYGMVLIMARAVGVWGIDIRHDFQTQSVVVAYCLGVLLTFVVVTISAWKVSVLNIVTAIRNLPEPVKVGTSRGSLALAVILTALGLLMAFAGLSGKEWTPLYVGVSLMIIAFLPAMLWLRLPKRAAYTVPGLLLVVWSLLPSDTLDPVLPEMAVDFSSWVTGGVITVLGATWVVMYNSDILLKAVLAALSRLAWLTPVLKTAIAYPLTNRFRTGMTLAMFTLVVFNLVVGAATTTSFTEAWNDVTAFGGGYDIRATTVRINPVEDMGKALAGSETLDERDFETTAGQSVLGLDARQLNQEEAVAGAYAVRGLDDTFLATNEYELGAMAEGYTSARQVWEAIRQDPHLAVVDALPVPHRADFSFGAEKPDFQMTGLYADDTGFKPVPVELSDRATGKKAQVQVIGIMKDAAPFFMVGILTNQRLMEESFPEQATIVTHFVKLRDGVDVEATADELESTFLVNGLEAEVMQEELDKMVGTNQTFVYILQGFLGLGLIVGVAALGVISARSVVERRHEIGVMRSIGYERRMVQLSFLLESSMVALVALLLGTVLGIIVSYNVILDQSEQPSWENLRLVVPWRDLVILYVLVYGAALVTTFLPALQASRVYPAEALRYE
jgi:putative ABC transport system permease protein